MLVSRRVKTLVQSWDFYSCQSGDATYRLPGAEGLDAFCATARRDGDNFAVKVAMGDGDLGSFLLLMVQKSQIKNHQLGWFENRMEIIGFPLFQPQLVSLPDF